MISNNAINRFNDKLMLSVNENDIEGVRNSLDKGADINYKDDYQNTALHVAAELGDLNIIRLLLEKGSTIDCKNNQGKTPLHKILSSENSIRDISEIVELLTKNLLEIDCEDNFGCTPLYYAIVSRHYDVATLLIKKGASVDYKNRHGDAMMHNFARGGDLEAIEFLTKQKASINIRNSEGRNPIYYSAINTNLNLSTFFIRNGADLECRDNQGNTPLLFVANYINNASRVVENLNIEIFLNIIKLFISSGADVDVRNNEDQQFNVDEININDEQRNMLKNTKIDRSLVVDNITAFKISHIERDLSIINNKGLCTDQKLVNNLPKYEILLEGSKKLVRNRVVENLKSEFPTRQEIDCMKKQPCTLSEISISAAAKHIKQVA